MKGIVLELRDGMAAVLREDGIVVKVRQRCEVGDTIEIKENKTPIRMSVMRYASVAAAAVLLVSAGGLYGYQNAMACSYVSLDINPSIEFVLNRRDRVLDVTALNEDAEDVVKRLKEEEGVMKTTLDEALARTELVLQEMEYITDDEEDYILVNVATDSETRKAALTETASQALSKTQEKITVVVIDSSVETREKAKELGISAGRYQEMQAIETAVAGEGVEPDQETVSKYENTTVQEILFDAGQLPEEHRPDSRAADNMTQSQPAATEAVGGARDENGPGADGTVTGGAPAADTAGEKPGDPQNSGDQAAENKGTPDQKASGNTAPDMSAPGSTPDSEAAGGNTPDSAAAAGSTSDGTGTAPSQDLSSGGQQDSVQVGSGTAQVPDSTTDFSENSGPGGSMPAGGMNESPAAVQSPGTAAGEDLSGGQESFSGGGDEAFSGGGPGQGGSGPQGGMGGPGGGMP